MWVQAGFSPCTFYEQTPRNFQLAMRGVRKRMESDAQARTALAYESGAFAGLASNGKLKPLKHYMGQRQRRQQTPSEMLAVFRAFQAAGANMTIRKIGE